MTQGRQSAAQHNEQHQQAALSRMLICGRLSSIHSHSRQDTQKTGDANS
jgi:hypothetical protein